MGSSDCRLNSLRKLWVKTAIEWRSKELNSSTRRGSGCAAIEDVNARLSKTTQ